MPEPSARERPNQALAADAGMAGATGRSAVVWNVLREVVAARSARTGSAALDIVDVGGGTGGFAVPFAALGHRVTVVDPSPDALAAARRRAAEVHVPLNAVQGEADGLDSLVGESAADLVICHSVLEYVDSPAGALAAIARVLRPGATVSVLAANAVAAVLHRALTGRYEQALQLLGAIDDQGQAPRRFTLAELTAIIEAAGLRPGDAHGVRIFTGLVTSPAAGPGLAFGGGSPPAAEPDAAAARALRSLEEAAAVYPALREIASRLHVLGHR